MTEDFWNRQMQFSTILPEFAAYLDRMAAESAEYSLGRAFDRKAYGEEARQWVEWTHGSGTGDLLPVVIHGGYWRALRAEDHRFMLAGFGALGATVANLEYRLMPGVRLDHCVRDAQDGLRCLAERFVGKRMVLIGHSAGAHLAVSSLADPGIAARTAGVIALSGVYDLRPAAQSFLQAELNLTEQEVATHSLAPRAGRPPVLYVNGSAETYEFLRGSALMASAGRAGWRVLPDADHMTLTWAATAHAKALCAEMLAL